MTAQFPDVFRYRRVDHTLAGISKGTLFDPSEFGMQPVSTCTGCWRGYVAGFAIADSRLVLDRLAVSLCEPGEGRVPKEGPPINGVSPTGPGRGIAIFNNHYVGLNYHLDYTGGLLLARDFIEELYVHMGFHPAWKYQHVIELVFDGGILQQAYDRSEQVAQLRQRILESGDSGRFAGLQRPDAIRDWIESTFDRTYWM